MKKGWEIKKLGEVCEFENGDRGVNYPSKAHRTETGLPFINAGHLTSDGLDLDSMDYISRERYNLLGSGKIKKGDILFCLRGSLGKFAKIQEFSEGAIASSLVIVRPKLKVTSDFVMHYFESKICSDMIADFGNGAAQPNLSAGSLKNFEIPLPSLPEQQRIVVILNEVFEAIAKAKANAEQNLKNAKELFESYLQDVFENKGEGWEEKTLGGIYDVRDGTHDSPKYQEEGFPLITSKNLKKDLLNYDNVKYISEQDYININKRSKVDKGDILFAMIGTIGNPVVIKDEPDFAIKNVALFKVPNSQNSNFLKYFLDAKSNIDKMMGDAKGTTQKFVGLGYLRAFKILLPPLKDQQIIVRKLDALSLETKKLEAIYQQKINDLEELKKSVLQKAFAGELKENLKEHYAENA